jgi:hypothetical protein
LSWPKASAMSASLPNRLARSQTMFCTMLRGEQSVGEIR